MLDIRRIASLLWCGILPWLIPHASAAETDMLAYKCLQPKAQGDDWIQPLIFIARDRQKERVVVSDALILHFNDGQPVEARIVTDNPSRITFAWDLDIRASSLPRQVRYRGTFVKKSRVFSVSASAHGGGATLTAVGSCQVDRLGR